MLADSISISFKISVSPLYIEAKSTHISIRNNTSLMNGFRNNRRVYIKFSFVDS